MGSKPKAPKVPTAGENYASAIEAYLENQGSLREAEFFDQLSNLEMLSTFAPAAAELQLAFESQFGTPLRAAESEATRQTRLGDIANIQELGPAFQQALSASSDPQAEAIRQELGRQVMGELSAGQGMSPELQREVEQGVRRAQGARGIVRGSSPVAAEAFARGSRGLQLQQQRQQAADNFLRQTAATRPDAFSFITGRQGVQQANPALAPQTGGQGMGVGQLFGATTDASNLQSQLSYNAAQAGAGGGIGGLAGGALGGAAMAKGAGMGSVFGLPGMAVGAGLGGIAGLF